MVLDTTIDAMKKYLKKQGNYSIWATTMLLLRDRIEASNYERVFFVVCDNESCMLQGWSSPQSWASKGHQAFLSQILALPPDWPYLSVGLHQYETLGVDESTNTIKSVYVRTSPCSCIFPSDNQTLVNCDALHRLGDTGSVFVLRKGFLKAQFLLSNSLQTCLCAPAPELFYFRVWLGTAGLAELPSQSGNYTLLAPINSAFEALARAVGVTTDELVRNPSYAYMASYHVMCGFFGPLASKQIPAEATAASDGFLLSFKSSTASTRNGETYAHYVNFANIDLNLSKKTDNGILYIIDMVLSHGSSGPVASF